MSDQHDLAWLRGAAGDDAIDGGTDQGGMFIDAVGGGGADEMLDEGLGPLEGGMGALTSGTRRDPGGP
ncbi:MAG: hypothetical protein ACKORK_05970, partial [Gemmatimonadota bacterium]